MNKGFEFELDTTGFLLLIMAIFMAGFVGGIQYQRHLDIRAHSTELTRLIICGPELTTLRPEDKVGP